MRISFRGHRGEVSLYGQRLAGNNNLTDLVADVLRNTKMEHENRSRFLAALRDINTPSALIKNKNALRDYTAAAAVVQRPIGVPDDMLTKTERDDGEEKVKWPRHTR